METNLTDEINTSELGFFNYKVYRCDRSSSSSNKKSGGGVIIAIRDDLDSWELPSSNFTVECVFFAINLKNSIFVVGGVYLPPNQNSSQYNEFSTSLEELLITYPDITPLIIVGDFNLPNVDWLNPSTSHLDPSAQCIHDVMSFLNLEQYNNVRNNREVLLDLVFSSIVLPTKVAIDPLLTVERHHPALEMEVSIVNSLGRT